MNESIQPPEGDDVAPGEDPDWFAANQRKYQRREWDSEPDAQDPEIIDSTADVSDAISAMTDFHAAHKIKNQKKPKKPAAAKKKPAAKKTNEKLVGTKRGTKKD
jgi:hypothetical protein